MQTNILMFFLGALTFYLISAITGELLDYFKIVDVWDYGAWYCGIPFVPFILIYYFFKKRIKTIKNKCFHPHDKRSFIKRIFGYCDCPNHKRHWFVYPDTIRCNTRYQDEDRNWITCCEELYETEVAPQIEEMWHEYYSSRF